MRLIVGLGNPGIPYERTRHNVGFLVLDELAKRLSVKFRLKPSLEAEVVEATVGETRFLLCKPQTFMNLSGRSVKTIIVGSNILPADVLVVYDDADLPFGDIRYRSAGTSGGHNGMQSVLEAFPAGTELPRLRVGIGRPTIPDMALEDWVLAKWTDAEAKALPDLISNAAEEVLKHAS